MASNVSMPIGVSCADVGTFSAHEMATGRGFHRQISPIKGQIAIYRLGIGPDSLRDALRASLSATQRESSSESWLIAQFYHR